MQTCLKFIKRTDENDVAFLQFTVICTSLYEVQIYHPLIISCTFWEIAVILCLHLAVIDNILVVLAVHVKPDSFSIRRNLNRFLLIEPRKCSYLFSDNKFQQSATQLRVCCQHLTEHKIICKAQFFIFVH